VITYRDDADGLTPAQLEGFFVGWPAPPPPAVLLDVLRGSAGVWLALDGERVVGFVTAISDGVLAASLPLLEVLPAFQGRGIGTELVRRMLATLDDLYALDVTCDPDVAGFYERFGLQPAVAMVRRTPTRIPHLTDRAVDQDSSSHAASSSASRSGVRPTPGGAS
jgi:GNAT superfamily N-acetyltransferase